MLLLQAGLALSLVQLAGAPAPAPPAPGAVDVAALTAHPWAPTGRCAEALTFRPDGTATMRGNRMRWRLEGDRLIVSMPAEGDFPITIRRDGRDLLLTSEGESERVSPCPAR